MATIDRTLELAPGVHRIETVVDGKLHGYHVLDGPTGPIIVDPGYKDAPTTVYEPFLTDRGQSLADVSLAIITHADADHHGGNHQLRTHSPNVVIAAHEADVPVIESVDRIMDEQYGAFATDHNIEYDDETKRSIRSAMGADEPVDLRLTGGEHLAVGDRELAILHTPGHRPGHLMLYDAEYDLVIGGDGFFGRGVTTVDGDPIQPPPYRLYPEYRNSIQLVSALAPAILSFTHFDVLRDDDIADFVRESLAFASELTALTLELADEHGPITLRESIDAVVDRKGDFGLNLDFAEPLTAHYRDHVERGALVETEKDGVVAWDRQ